MARPEAYSGRVYRLVYAECFDGSHPAKSFFDSLPGEIKKKFGVSFKKLGDMGKLYNEEHFKIVEGTDFFEFKVHRYRIICRFLPGKIVLLTNGCEKKKNKLDKEDIERADRFYQEDKSVAVGKPPARGKGN